MLKRSYFFVVLVLILSSLACTISGGGGNVPPPATPTFTPEPVIDATITATPTPDDGQPPADQPPADSPAATDTPPSSEGEQPLPGVLYGVTFVDEDDTLNVRSGPGVNSEVVATFPPLFAAIQITGPGQEADGGLWVPIQRLEAEGWVNRFFLTEVVASEDFCANPETQAVVDGVRTAIANSDGPGLKVFVHPTRGLWLRLNWWNEEVGLSQAEVDTFFTDATVRDWGIADGSGEPITGSVADVAVPLLQADLNAPDAQVACNEILQGGTAGLVVTPPKYGGINYYSVHRPPAEDGDFDWGTWVIGIEYYNGTPFLSYLVHYQWEI